MEKSLSLNVKIPRLGRNRLGVFFVRSSVKDRSGKTVVLQVSLRTKDPGLAKLLGLKFCTHLALGGSMMDFRQTISTYIVENGRIEASGEDGHRRAMEAQKAQAEAQERRIEAETRRLVALRRLEIEELRLRHERDALTRLTPVELQLEERRRLAYATLAEVNAPEAPARTVMPTSASVYRPQVDDLQPSPPPFDQRLQVSVRAPILLKDEMNRHLQEEISKGKIKAQTISEKRAVFSDFLTCFGEDVALNDITFEDVTTRWRPSEFKRSNKKDIESQKKNTPRAQAGDFVIGTLSPNRLEKRRSYLKKFFDWAIKSHTYDNANPMEQAMFDTEDIEDATESYHPFTQEDLLALFSINYVQAMFKPDWYWVPLIALFSGARQSEICGLQLKTFEVVDGIEIFRIIKGKNKYSKRTVPIHSTLLQLGLWEYVESLKARGCKVLLPHRPTKYITKSIGRQWGLWVTECNITDEQKTFHSFRSTAITDMNNVGENKAGHMAIKRLVGHSTSDVHEEYVRGLELIILKSAVETINYKGLDVSHLKLEDPTFKVFFDEHFAGKVVNTVTKKNKEESRRRHEEAKKRRENGWKDIPA